jgi:hypothetical protein
MNDREFMDKLSDMRDKVAKVRGKLQELGLGEESDNNKRRKDIVSDLTNVEQKFNKFIEAIASREN